MTTITVAFEYDDAGRIIKQVTTETGGNSISGYKTCELVTELLTREGVEIAFTEPPHCASSRYVAVDGPATVIVVKD